MSYDPRLQLGNIRFPWRTLSSLKVLFPDQEARHKASNDLGLEAYFSHPPQANLGEVSTNSMGAFEVVNQMKKVKSVFEKSQVDSKYNTEGKAGESTASKDMFLETVDPLLSAMDARRGFLASDPRDRVFAHLGFDDYLNLTPDYGMNCQQVFKTFAERHISVTNSLDVFSYVEDIELGQRMQGIPTWVPDWTRRHENPRYRVLTSQASAYWYGKHSYTFGSFDKRKPNSFGAHNFQADCFTTKAFYMASITKLGRVLDTTSYKKQLTSKSGLVKFALSWMADQSGIGNVEQELGYMFEFEKCFGEFAIEELQSAKEKDGCLLDGRRLAVLEYNPSPLLGAEIINLFALVPASSKEGDLIYYPQ
jgi:hypothetical protein